MFTRENTRQIKVRGIPIGGGSPVTVQSMTNTCTQDVESTLNQIRTLVSTGCDMVRLAVPDSEAAEALVKIRKQTDIPLIADIHFDYKLAIQAIEAGVDKLRINPGNIGESSRVKAVAQAAKEKGIPVRVGVNAGSLKKELLARYGGPTPEALVESAIAEVDLLDDLDFHDVCVSIKSSNVPATLQSYLLFAEKRNNSLHIGITEAGTLKYGTIKSACGIGAILSYGIGDTLRVSLTSDPVEEVTAGISILKAMGLRKSGAEVISCPTCGRTAIDIIALADAVERRAAHIKEPIVIAVMGCVVNGPGEAREADYGIAGGKGTGLLFRKGEKIRTVPESELVDELFALIENDLQTR
ncbi:MAG: flavodoxin-dependent (E)-4-hydroxy-3-methylbut-2-enyl-diphosphate synthase [Candidatus Latescibacteria bacterium]|nr:flavodoxin-dependent (E)-4-hydroxy-3-methylbut-2-enyl-diphosphate synthase [Candidatus Latescibacterota bacterium]